MPAGRSVATHIMNSLPMEMEDPQECPTDPTKETFPLVPSPNMAPADMHWWITQDPVLEVWQDMPGPG